MGRKKYLYYKKSFSVETEDRPPWMEWNHGGLTWELF